MQKSRKLGVVLAAALWVGVAAQVKEPPKEPPKEVPALSKDVRDAITAASSRLQALSYAEGVLQKEADSAAADLQRALKSAAAQCAADASYELGPALACQKKKVP